MCLMKEYISTRTWVSAALSVCLVGASVFAGYSYGKSEAKAIQVPESIVGSSVPSGVSESVDFQLFWKVWNLLDEKYGGVEGKEVTDQEKVYSAIQGLAAAYGDPYTTFFPPEESKSFEEEISGSFEGVGMEVSLKDGVITVVAPLKGSPAQRAGILPGDKLIQIDDISTIGLSIDESIKLIKGPKGSSVRLTVLREGKEEPVTISVVRDVIKIPTLETELLTGNVFVVRLYNFTGTAEQNFRQAMQQFIRSGSKKLIIDVRGNPGGYLDAAVDIASWFLPSGSVVVTEQFNDQKNNVFRSKGYQGIPNDTEIVVLIDEGSASASEILAGALKEYDKATLIGKQTFGKGSVQEYMRTSANTSLKVTVAEWLTPRGNSISKDGLKPDIEVDRSAEDATTTYGSIGAGLDAQLERAVEFLRTAR